MIDPYCDFRYRVDDEFDYDPDTRRSYYRPEYKCDHPDNLGGCCCDEKCPYNKENRNGMCR